MLRTFVVVLLSVVLLHAVEPMAWDFTKQNVWNPKNTPVVKNDFGPLGETTEDGFYFCIDKKYRNIWIDNLPKETAQRYSHLEFFHRGRLMLYTLLAYGQGEGGYGRERCVDGQWPGESRYYPNRHVVDLRKCERWRQGGVNRLLLTISYSGEGQDATLSAIAFRRAADTLHNGALMLRGKDGSPLFWSVEESAKVEQSAAFPLPVCNVSGGFVSTELVSLKPDHSYAASCFIKGKAIRAFARIYDGDGGIIAEYPLGSTLETQGGFILYRSEYIVPNDAHHGEIVISAHGQYSFADALVEDLGGKQTWQAEWIWTP